MENKENTPKTTGFALLLGSFLMFATMVLHPAGGSFEHLLKATKFIVISHALAIASVPLSIFGFWGLLKRFTNHQNLSMAAFIFMVIGQFAGLIAATINGLTLPFFINQYKDATPETLETIKIVLRYGSSLNHAFDYILIGNICVATFIWSVLIVKTKELPVWLGYLGILFNVVFVILLLSNFNLLDLFGFRIFIFSLVIWILGVGIFQVKFKNNLN